MPDQSHADQPVNEGASLFERDEEFTSLYANNIQFEASVWDLKMIFGELDQSRKPNVVDQHTSITLSWPQVKVASYYLLVNLIFHQATHGQMQLPTSVTPPRPDPSDSSLDESGKKLVVYLAWVYDQFFGPNQFVPPDSGPTQAG